MSETMFQKKELKKLTSPDQLDELIMVTTPRGWLAFLPCAPLLSQLYSGGSSFGLEGCSKFPLEAGDQ